MEKYTFHPRKTLKFGLLVFMLLLFNLIFNTGLARADTTGYPPGPNDGNKYFVIFQSTSVTYLATFNKADEAIKDIRNGNTIQSQNSSNNYLNRIEYKLSTNGQWIQNAGPTSSTNTVASNFVQLKNANLNIEYMTGAPAFDASTGTAYDLNPYLDRNKYFVLYTNQSNYTMLATFNKADETKKDVIYGASVRPKDDSNNYLNWIEYKLSNGKWIINSGPTSTKNRATFNVVNIQSANFDIYRNLPDQAIAGWNEVGNVGYPTTGGYSWKVPIGGGMLEGTIHQRDSGLNSKIWIRDAKAGDEYTTWSYYLSVGRSYVCGPNYTNCHYETWIKINNTNGLEWSTQYSSLKFDIPFHVDVNRQEQTIKWTIDGNLVHTTHTTYLPGFDFLGDWNYAGPGNTFTGVRYYVDDLLFFRGNTSSGLKSSSNLAKQAPNQLAEQSLIADPIDSSSGAHIIDKMLFKGNGAFPLNFNIHYNSLTLNNGLLGRGWTDDYETSIKVMSDSSLLLQWNANRQNVFKSTGNNVFKSSDLATRLDSLVKNVDGTYTLTRHDQSVYQFDASGKLVQQTNGHGGVINYAYNTDNTLTSVTDPLTGQTLTFNYNAVGKLTSVSDTINRQTSFDYDANNNLTTITDANGKKTTYTYNFFGQVLSATDSEGIKLFENTYDSVGRVVKQKDALGKSTEFVYDETSTPGKLITTATNREGKVRKLTHDSNYRLVEIVDDLGNTTSYTYDANGNRIAVVDANGQTTTMTYDDRSNLLSVTDAVYGTIRMTYDNRSNVLTVTNAVYKQVMNTYDGNNNLTSTTDANGNTTRFTYDANGLLASKTAPDGGVTSYSYTNGKITSSTDPEGNITTYAYDAAGRLISITDPLGSVTRMEYDNTDHVTRTIDPLGYETAFTYNSHGDLLSKRDALGNTTSYAYNGNGKMISVTDAVYNTTRFEYDSEDRLIRTIDPLANVLTNIYDAKGRLVQTIDALGNVTAMEYDPIDQLLRRTNPEGNAVSYSYNPTGHMVQKTDGTGQIIGMEYDPAGQLLATTDPLNGNTRYAYDGNGNTRSQTDPLGSTLTYTYESMNRIQSITDANGNTTQNVYNKNGKLISVTDAVYGTTRYEYDANSRLIKTIDAAGAVTANEYDAKGWLVKKTNVNGGITLMMYDALDRLIRRTDAEGSVESFEYDTLGRLIRKIDAAGKITGMTYDALGRLLTETNPLGHTTRYTYDANGHLLTQTDPKGNVTRFTYNKNGKLTSVTDAVYNTTQYEYDAEDRLLKTVDPLGSATIYSYDALGRLIQTTDPLGNTNQMTFDAAGNLIRTVDAKGNITFTATYDQMHRQLTVTDALEHTTAKQYDAANRLTQITDPLGRTTTRTYNSIHQMVSTMDAQNGESKQTFDSIGNLTSFTDPNGNTTAYAYDKIGRMLSETSAAGGTIRYEYDSRGLLALKINARGMQTSYAYDDSGRLAGLTDPNGTASYTYDENGNALTVTGSTYGTKTRVYDALNRVVEYTDERGNTLRYAYDTAGNLTQLTYPDGKTVTYTYDAAGRMTSVTDWAGRRTVYAYDANGRLITTTRPDGSIETRTYDAARQLQEIQDIAADGTILVQDGYSYDAAGNVTAEKNQINQYDENNRLIIAGGIRYGYDAAGNLTSESSTVTGATYKSMTYAADNRLAAYNGQAVVYDADGNMTSGPLGEQMQSFEYDARNRLVRAGDVSYTYDTENIRISMTVTGATYGTVTGATYGTVTGATYYVVNPHAYLSQLLMETDEQGHAKAYYVYGLGLIGREDAGGNYSVYHFDRRGSTTVLTNVYGNVTDRYAYGAYGELLIQEGTTPNPFLYNGRDGVMTDSNGLYYMRARYYNPDIKRFINRDVVTGSIDNGQTLNRYAYVNGNPISYVDPFGLSRDGDEVSGWAKTGSFALDFVPWLSTGKGYQQAISGVDLITGENLTAGDRWAEGIGATASIIPFPGAKHAGKYITKGVIWTGKKAGQGISWLWNKGKPAVREFIADERGSINLFGKGTGKGFEGRGYKPQPGERTFEGYVKDNVPVDKETKLFTNSKSFNTNPKNDGQFKRFGTDSHAGLSPHVHQPKRNVAPDGTIHGSVGKKTNDGGVIPPNNKDVSQLYDYLNNGKYLK